MGDAHQEELDNKEKALAELMKGFEERALNTAKAGGIRRDELGPAPGGAPRGGAREGFENFGGRRDQRQVRTHAYIQPSVTWSAPPSPARCQ